VRVQQIEALVINGANYSDPDPRGNKFCGAHEIKTSMGNRVAYELELPEGWVMAWASYKAYWLGRQHKTDGLLVIIDP
jgi:hypothetical protein